jgi:protein ImuB
VRQRRYLVAFLPDFRLERCGWTPEERAVLVGESRNALRVLALSAGARRAGLRVGMTVAEARALVPGVEVESANARQEAEDLDELAQQLLSVSPFVAPLVPDAVAAELQAIGGPGKGEQAAAGPGHGETELLGKVRARLLELGHVCRLVVAEDLRGARMLATWGRADRIVPPGGLVGAQAELPLEALEPEESLHLLLHELGLRTIGDFAALGASAVSRLGPEGARLRAVAGGLLFRPDFAAREEVEPFALREQLPEPVDGAEALLFVAHRLLLDLLVSLEERGRGATRLELALELDNGLISRLSFRLGRPSRNAVLLSRLLRRRIEGLSVEAPIVALRLSAIEHAAFDGSQEGVFQGPQGQGSLADLVAALKDGLGHAALFTPVARDTWRPERAWSAGPVELLPQLPSPEGPNAESPDERQLSDDPVEPHESWWRGLPLERPPILLAEARPVEIDPPEGPPRRICLDGRWLGVVSINGRESLRGEWWDRGGYDRAYLRLVLADGRVAWVYRELGRGFLHGWFDGGMPAEVAR